jgi:Zn-dependent protease with chaperone function
MIDIDDIRHPKEKTYYTIMMVVSIVMYILLCIPIFASFVVAIPFLLLFALLSWWISLRFKANLYGNSVHVNTKQYPELYSIAENQSKQLGVELPPLFIQNSQGSVNAYAAKIFLSKYIILESSLVDLMLSTNRTAELEMIIGHELAHHAAGHLSTAKKLLTTPGKLIPFIGAAYSRACELTCDRIGFVLNQNLEASQTALVALALGSKGLLSKSNTQAFIEQEYEIPEIAAFVNKLSATHPLTTVRVSQLQHFASQHSFANSQSISL